MNLKEQITKAASSVKEQLLQNRRHLHQHPELSFQEFQTSAFIKERLTELGIAWEPIAGTGVLAIIIGALSSDKVIALRADIDALPILEENDISYRSERDGVMHACGHDVHTSSLLGVAEILSEMKAYFGGTVKFIFQPAEEVLPGGAATVIEEGGLQNPAVQVVLGQHVQPSIATGKIGVRKGLFMASMDEIKIEISGKGGHGAEPHKSIDPVMIACTLLPALQQLVSRNANPLTPSVLSFGKLIANGAINIIPDKVFIEGTFRTLDEEWRVAAHRKIIEMATTLTEGMGGICNIDIRKGYPHLKNDTKFGTEVINYMRDFIGSENIIEKNVWMAAEDFAYYTQHLPSFFYLLGVGNAEKNIQSSLHTSTFNIDEDALVLGCGLMTYITLRWLGNDDLQG